MKKIKHLFFTFFIFIQITNAQQPFDFSIETSSGLLAVKVLGHAAIKMEWNNQIIYFDPYTKVADYSQLPKADFIIITHEHSDHFDPEAINQLITNATKIIYTSTCKSTYAFPSYDTVMANGDSILLGNFSIKAVPAYNIIRPRHEKGIGNGYLLWFGNQQIYVAGDTELLTENATIKNIEVAFIGFSKYNMDEQMFVDVISQMKPRFAVPIHYDDNDISSLLQKTDTVQGVTVLTAQRVSSTFSFTNNQTVEFYPNPVSGLLYCGQLNNDNFSVISISGEKVTSFVEWHNGYIDVSQLNKGIYLIIGNNPRHPFTFRFIVN